MSGRRRSLTIKDQNDGYIQHVRSKFLYANIESDYTTMLNIFIELGDMIIKHGTYTYNISDVVDIFKKYFEDTDKDVILNILTSYHEDIIKEEHVEKIEKPEEVPDSII